jgi:hypothetical protein
MQSDLLKEISATLNRHSAENASNTPDFILATYLTECLAAFNRACMWREKWHSAKGVPVSERETGPRIPHPGVKPEVELSPADLA